MFTWERGWFLTDIPYDCFYRPFFLVSGPVVYFFAHSLQHYSEQFFTPEQVSISWNAVPGVTCLILGGLQWWLMGRAWIWFRQRTRAEHDVPDHWANPPRTREGAA